MRTTICIAGLMTSLVKASTTIAVLEFGRKGSVHRTTSNSRRTSVAGVQSLWRAMSNEGPQHAGMTVVPDLFQKPKHSIVVGIPGVNLDSLPTLSKLTMNEGSNVVGHMNVVGTKSGVLCAKTGNSLSATTETMVERVKSQMLSNKLSSVYIETEVGEVALTDAKVKELIKFFENYAGESSVVVYLVVDKEESLTHRNLMSRRLEDADGDGDEEDGNDDDGNCEGVVGYINENGECYRPFENIFEIQYFNVVLGTSLGLVLLVFYALWLTVNMPLMPDTLLFGESVKVLGD